jgi:hypothetical protein
MVDVPARIRAEPLVRSAKQLLTALQAILGFGRAHGLKYTSRPELAP